MAPATFSPRGLLRGSVSDAATARFPLPLPSLLLLPHSTLDREKHGSTYTKVVDALSIMRKRNAEDRAVKLARARELIERENRARITKVPRRSSGIAPVGERKSTGQSCDGFRATPHEGIDIVRKDQTRTDPDSDPLQKSTTVCFSVYVRFFGGGRGLYLLYGACPRVTSL